MTATPWIQTASGRVVDLLTPSPRDVDFSGDVAVALARIVRFGGHAGPYTVAQHCALGARALLDETGNARLAAAFLLHDAHEAYVGDMTTPVADALVAHLDGQGFGHADRGASAPAVAFRAAFRSLKAGLDRAIYTAAGLDPAAAHHPEVKRMDLRMLDAERRQLLPPCPPRWPIDDLALPPVRLVGALRPWTFPTATERWLELLHQLCPITRPEAAA